MRLHKKTLKILVPITMLFLMLTIAFSFLQFKFSNVLAYSIINNICICILTSGLLICVQSIIAFYIDRKEAVLLFYKETIMFEKKLCDYPYINNGFSLAKGGLLEVLKMTEGFSDKLKWSYMQIDTSNKKSRIINALISLFSIYQIQICEFVKMEKLLKQALEFIGIPESELINQGVDINKETAMHNEKLQAQEKEIEKAFNDVDNNKRRNNNLDVIEEFLFNKKRGGLS